MSRLLVHPAARPGASTTSRHGRPDGAMWASTCMCSARARRRRGDGGQRGVPRARRRHGANPGRGSGLRGGGRARDPLRRCAVLRLCAGRGRLERDGGRAGGTRGVLRSGDGAPAGSADPAGGGGAGDARQGHQHALRAQHPARYVAARRKPARGGGNHARRALVELPAAQTRRRRSAARDLSGRNLLPPPCPGAGFGVQRVYTDDGSLDETMAFGDRDVVLVPKGYHPVGAPHGFDLYYLNVMAGPVRSWKFTMAPDHAWLTFA